MPLDFDDLAPMSIRKYSRLVNVSDTTIRTRIKEGVIVKGVDADGKIIPRYATQELSLTLTARPGPKVKRPESMGDTFDFGEDDDDLFNQDVADYSDGIPDTITKREADRLVAVFRAKKAQKEYEETAGILVNRALVYETLFNVAQGIRDNLMNVPDRCIDDVLASGNRNLAITRMGNEIAEALVALSNTADIKLLTKR